MDEEITITVTGPPGSGKSTFLRWLDKMLEAGAPKHWEWNVKFYDNTVVIRNIPKYPLA